MFEALAASLTIQKLHIYYRFEVNDFALALVRGLAQNPP